MKLFTCPVYTQTVKLRPEACGKRYRGASRKYPRGPRPHKMNRDTSWAPDAKCRGCKIGQQHARGREVDGVKYVEVE